MFHRKVSTSSMMMKSNDLHMVIQHLPQKKKKEKRKRLNNVYLPSSLLVGKIIGLLQNQNFKITERH